MATPENQNPSTVISQESPTQRLFSLISQTDMPEREIIAQLQSTLMSYPTNPDWLITDCQGDTLLHKAAKSLKPQVTKYLLTHHQILASLTNDEDLTPLQALQEHVDSLRHPFLGVFHCPPPGPFTGFPQSYIFCYAVLTNQEPVCIVPGEISTQALSNLTWTSDEDILLKTLRIKYGCTCGHCIAGFLSPRMRHALFGFARDYMFEFESQSDGPSSSYLTSSAGSFLPAVTRDLLREGKNPLVEEGFRLICEYIRQICAKRGKIPSKTNVMDLMQAQGLAQAQAQELPLSKSVEALDEFFKQGGTIEGVAKEMFEVAGVYFETVDDEFLDPKLPFNEYMAKLAKGKGKEVDTDMDTPSKTLDTKKRPRCANDREMEFVMRMCGY